MSPSSVRLLRDEGWLSIGIGLTPDTHYRYFVAALDRDNRLSVPSNVLTIQTKVQDTGGNYPG